MRLLDQTQGLVPASQALGPLPAPPGLSCCLCPGLQHREKAVPSWEKEELSNSRPSLGGAPAAPPWRRNTQHVTLDEVTLPLGAPVSSSVRWGAAKEHSGDTERS